MKKKLISILLAMSVMLANGVICVSYAEDDQAPVGENNILNENKEENGKEGENGTGNGNITDVKELSDLKDTEPKTDPEPAAVYKITYELDGGTNYEGAPSEYSSAGEAITLGMPLKVGYLFKAWLIDTDADDKGDTAISAIDPVTGADIKLYASWEQIYKITYELDGGANYEGAPTEYTVSTEKITLRTPSKEGYVFLGWASDTEKTTDVTEIAGGAEGDITLYAKWIQGYKITYVLNGGELYAGAPTYYTSETPTIKLGVPTKTGYAFDSWFKDEKFNYQAFEIKKGSSGDITLYAAWRKSKGGKSLGGAKYFVEFDSNGGSSVQTQTILLNHTANRPENPYKRGYTFAGWYTDPALTEKFDFETKINKFITLYAKWIESSSYNDDAEEYEIADTGDVDDLIVLKIGSKMINVNGKTFENDVAPIIKNERTMMPVRVIAESLGADVKWDAQFRIVTITNKGRQVVLHIDSDIAYINGNIYELDSPAFISEDRTYIPVRFVSEALSCAVDWSEDSRLVTITRTA